MSKSNFLPFIKKTSSEEAIFKAILQRTKGSTSSALTNLFSVVLAVGVENLRTKIDSLDDNLTTSAKVAEIIAQETQHHVPQSEREFWSHVAKYVMPKNSNFSTQEMKTFFTVIAVHKPENLQKNGFGISSSLQRKLTEFSKESYEPSITGVPGIEISEDSSERIGFTCWEEFKAFLAIKSSDETTIKVSPAYIKTNADIVTDHIYSENHCVSPYVGKTHET